MWPVYSGEQYRAIMGHLFIKVNRLFFPKKNSARLNNNTRRRENNNTHRWDDNDSQWWEDYNAEWWEGNEDNNTRQREDNNKQRRREDNDTGLGEDNNKRRREDNDTGLGEDDNKRRREDDYTGSREDNNKRRREDTDTGSREDNNKILREDDNTQWEEIPSTSAAVQPPPKLTESPWRNTKSTHQNLIDEITSIEPKCTANVLLLGPTGSGKSSFINSVLSIGKGRRVNKAYTGNKETCSTTIYESYVDEGFLKHCRLWDSMSLENVLDGGLVLDDLVYLLKGHIKRGYKFNPKAKIPENDKFFLRRPGIEQQIHCVVLVLDSNTVDEIFLTPYIDKIKALQEQTRALNIPCVLVLTKIDEVCEAVRQNIEVTFMSLKVQSAVATAYHMLGIPEGNIHPVKNFEVDTEIDEATSTLILFALRQIMHFASDKTEELMKSQETGWGCSVS